MIGNNDKPYCSSRLDKHSTKPTTSTINITKLLAVNLFRLVTVLALIELIGLPQQVAAGRMKGLIYNKDGKFIYQPPRSSQGHIIVIDERPSSRESSHKNESNKTTLLDHAGFNTFQSLAAEPSFSNHQIQLISPAHVYHPSVRAIYPPPTGAGAVPAVRLISLSDAHGGAGSSAASSQQSPRVLAYPRVAGAPTTSLLPGHSIQVVPLIPFYPPQPVLSSRGSGHAAPIGFSIAQPIRSIGSVPEHELAEQQQPPMGSVRNNDFDGSIRQVATSGGYHHLAGRQRVAYEQEPQPSVIFEHPLPVAADMQAPSDMSSLDEQHAPSGPAPFSRGGLYLAQTGHQHHHQHHMKSSRGSPMHELDRTEDTEGEQVEYYNERSRGRMNSGAFVGPNNEQHSKSSLQEIALLPAAPRGGFMSPHVQASDVSPNQRTVQLNDAYSIGAPLPRNGKHPRRNVSSRAKVGGTKKPSDTKLLDHYNEPFEHFAPGKEPKSIQYWKQFKDQFDIM